MHHDEVKRAAAIVSGVVQGVGFRPYIYRLARKWGLSGLVYNDTRGVVIEVEGPASRVEAFLEALPREAPPLASILQQDVSWIDPLGETEFRIAPSETVEEAGVLITPDVAICDDCLREFSDPEDRRYGYPFINCTNCGPRFTIIKELPYDRQRTTMSVFKMCPDCQKEYADPENRRFHAQPNACLACGPHVWTVEAGDDDPDLLGERPSPSTAEVFDGMRRRLKEGAILAVKGLGGFHLICDAHSQEAVTRLRERKRRPARPFAVMCRDLETVRRYCRVFPEEDKLLTGWRKPIVLLYTLPEPRRPLAEAVAPGMNTLGVMLPYTPLHLLLFDDEVDCLIATSGNLSEMPLAKDNDAALAHLSSMADVFLLHNREIYNRCDDSVTALAGGRVMLYRRSRGYAPAPVIYRDPLPSILAMGGDQKNTICLTKGKRLFLSQHIGEISSLEGGEFLTTTVRRFQGYFGLEEPELAACDMHPEYRTTKLAQDLFRGRTPLVQVQHHKAHLAACLVEHQIFEPVVGVICDGTGYGEDGHLWGFEFFAGALPHFERRGQLAYTPLPGGEAAIRHPLRMLYAHILTHLGEAGLTRLERLIPRMDEAQMGPVRIQIRRGLNAPLASSGGRLFDAVSALAGVCREGTYEGQPAMELEAAVEPPVSPDGPVYSFRLSEGEDGYLVIDPAPLWDDLLREMERGTPPGQVATVFHRTVAVMILEGADRIRQQTGSSLLALGGGVFQNRTLLELLLKKASRQGWTTYFPQQIPANDGGISLGQAVLAPALVRGLHL